MAAPKLQCPGCSGDKFRVIAASVYECQSCLGIIGYGVPQEKSYDYVLPRMARETVPHENLRYYDFCGLAGPFDGRFTIYRRHGWFDPATRLIHQSANSLGAWATGTPFFRRNFSFI